MFGLIITAGWVIYKKYYRKQNQVSSVFAEMV